MRVPTLDEFIKLGVSADLISDNRPGTAYYPPIVTTGREDSDQSGNVEDFHRLLVEFLSEPEAPTTTDSGSVGFTPSDYLAPDWESGGRAHNWHNYTSEEIRLMWPGLSPELRAALARQADESASKESWD